VIVKLKSIVMHVEWSYAKTQVHDASTIDDPTKWLWEKRNNCYYPIKKIASSSNKIYFLFGEEASDMYFNGDPVQEILKAAEDGEIRYDLFVFEIGVTHPASLLASFTSRNWKEYCVLDSKDDFEILNTAG